MSRQHSAKKKSDVNSDGLFVECHLSGTRQRIFFLKILCRVPYSCTRQRNFFFLKKKSLPSAMALALGKAGKLGLCFPALPSAMVTALGKALFAECGTRQRGGKCYFFCFLLSISTNKEITYISTHSIGYITYTSIFHHIHIHNPSHTHPPSIIHHIQIHCP